MSAETADSRPAPLETRMRARGQLRSVPLRAAPAPPGRLQPMPATLPPRSARLLGARSASPHRLPLYHRPGSVVLLDDDADFLEMLAGSLPPHWNIEAFVKPHA